MRLYDVTFRRCFVIYRLLYEERKERRRRKKEERRERKEKEGKSALNKWNFLLASLKKYKSNNTVTKINIYIYIYVRDLLVYHCYLYIYF